MSDKEKVITLVRSLKSLSEEIQKKLGRDRGIVHAVSLLENNKIDATFQRICLVSYKLFPESFSLTEFPDVLDSRIVRNCLWHCTHVSKGWLIGSDKTNYSTTQKGKEEISFFSKLKDGADIENLPLKFKLRKNDLITKSNDKDVNYLTDIQKSAAFSKFMNGKLEEISSLEVRKSLGGDRYSSSVYIQNKMKRMIDIATFYKESEVLNYLIWIKEGQKI